MDKDTENNLREFKDFVKQLDVKERAAHKQERAERIQESKTGFHAIDGWFFKRMPNGNVRISKENGTLAQVELDANTWASVVCSVSSAGEDFDRFNHVLKFHGDASGTRD